jgi:acyl-CoA dehydrogenase
MRNRVLRALLDEHLYDHGAYHDVHYFQTATRPAPLSAAPRRLDDLRRAGASPGDVLTMTAADTPSAEELALLAGTSAELFASHGDLRPPAGEWDARLWRALEDSALTLVSVPESAGGSGGTLREAAVVLGAVGEHAAGVPLAETALLGGWLLAAASLGVPAGPLAAAQAPQEFTVERAGGGWSARGRLPRVPWGRAAVRVAVAAKAGDETLVLSLRPQDAVAVPGVNVAGEPRDDLQVQTVLAAQDVAAVAPGVAEELRRRHALARTVLLAGAARRALELTLRHTAEREQQQVAELAAEVAAMRAAADAAVELCAAEGVGDERAGLAVAAAKIQAGRGAGVVSRIAHQLHGAIGFTEEHPLRLSTTRLWAWRDEAGNDAEWAAELGDRALAAGSDGIWPLLADAG